MTTCFAHILFDLDGTLLDTAPDLAFALNLLLKQYNQQPLPYDLIRPYASRGSRGLLELGFGITPKDSGYNALKQEYLTLYEQHLLVNTCFFPGVLEFLQALSEHHILWGIVTNKPHFLTKALLAKIGLDQQTDCIVSGDTCAKPKPDPMSIYYACELLTIEPQETLYVGDTLCDVLAAKNAGMKVAVVNYGYQLAEENALSWNADFYVDHIEQLKPLLISTC